MRCISIVCIGLWLVGCGVHKTKDEAPIKEPIELSPLDAWKKRADEQRAWQSLEGLFIGNATYLESTNHFLVPLDFKGEVSMSDARKLFSLKKATPIYDSPYLKRWQITQEGRKMMEIPQFKAPTIFKVRSSKAILVNPYKMEIYQGMVDVKAAHSFSTTETITEHDALYFFINDTRFKTSETLPVASEKDFLQLSKVEDNYLQNIKVLSNAEFEDGKGNFFGYANFLGDTSATSIVSEHKACFYASLYGERLRFVLPRDLSISELFPTHLLVSEQPVFIAKLKMLTTDYIFYRPLYMRDFSYYDCALDGFLKD